MSMASSNLFKHLCFGRRFWSYIGIRLKFVKLGERETGLEFLLEASSFLTFLILSFFVFHFQFAFGLTWELEVGY
jgi:hypothetical protein